jgi:glutamate racemase
MELNEPRYSVAASAPIGIFDSGPGGLAVLQQVMRYLPNEDVLYVGDTARQPYGPQPVENVRRYAEEISSYLFSLGVKIILIGCNTASVAGLDAARRRLPEIPILGMIEPGVRAALDLSRTQRIGIWGTEMTVEERAYDRLILEQLPEAEVLGIACSRLLRLTEKGLVEDRALLKELCELYFQPLREFEIDSLVLGCTDLTCVRDIIEEVAGPGVQVIDPAEEIIREAIGVLSSCSALRAEHDRAGRAQFFVSDENLAEFRQFTCQFLDIPSADVKKVVIPEIQ